jgi:hypothetical protein
LASAAQGNDQLLRLCSIVVGDVDGPTRRTCPLRRHRPPYRRLHPRRPNQQAMFHRSIDAGTTTAAAPIFLPTRRRFAVH